MRFSTLLTTSAVALLFLSVSCRSSTTINTTPSGATLTINGNNVGTTPYTYSDTKVLFAKQQVSVEKPGYERFDGFIQRDDLATGYFVVGILCFWPTLLWAWEYPPSYNFTLKKVGEKSAFDPFNLDSQKIALEVTKYTVPFRNPELVDKRTVNIAVF